MQEKYLIVGLGNPGVKYCLTRHNFGFLQVSHLAKEWKIDFKKHNKIEGLVAEGFFGSYSIVLLQPLTYMNRSGIAVKAALSLYHIQLSKLFVAVDDLHTPFGCIKLKSEGSSAGHHGIDSIKQIVGPNFTRLRLGLGEIDGPFDEYVLSEFTLQEQQELPTILDKGQKVIEAWIEQGIAKASSILRELKH